MRHLFRRLVIATLACVLIIPVGCGKNESEPNPDLKVPDVPPGGRDSKGPLKTGPEGKPDPNKT